MENAVDALEIGFAILVFVIALSMVFQFVSLARETSDIVTFSIDKTNFYPKVNNDLIDSNGNRIVGADVVISNLYRYYNESFAVIIKDSSGALIGKFDSETESGAPWTQGVVKGRTPWLQGNEYWRYRVDLFLNKNSGYSENFMGQSLNPKVGFGEGTGQSGKWDDVKNQWTISEKPFKSYMNSKFKEEFIETTYNGKYMTESDGSIITITPGGKKIYIYYTVI